MKIRYKYLEIKIQKFCVIYKILRHEWNECRYLHLNKQLIVTWIIRTINTLGTDISSLNSANMPGEPFRYLKCPLPLNYTILWMSYTLFHTVFYFSGITGTQAIFFFQIYCRWYFKKYNKTKLSCFTRRSLSPTLVFTVSFVISDSKALDFQNFIFLPQKWHLIPWYII